MGRWLGVCECATDNGWTDGQMNGWMDGWTDGQIACLLD